MHPTSLQSVIVLRKLLRVIIRVKIFNFVKKLTQGQLLLLVLGNFLETILVTEYIKLMRL